LASAFDFFVWRGFDFERLLDQPVEEEPARARFAAIEPKCEFVEIVVEVLRLDAALMRADQPSLEQ
jgi:hypothetical protein